MSETELIIRDAVAGDAPAIAAIWNPLIERSLVTFYADPLSVAAIQARISERQGAGLPFLIAQAGDVAPLGFATYGPFRAMGGYEHVGEHTIMLAGEVRGRGVGRALMERVETHARDHGRRIMVAAISGENPAAIGFHARLGYVETGRMPRLGRKLGQWCDMVLMQKTLVPFDTGD